MKNKKNKKVQVYRTKLIVYKKKVTNTKIETKMLTNLK